MRKLPGFAVVGQAYRFLFRDLTTIVRLAWAPLLIATVVQYFVSRTQLGDAITAFESGDLTALMSVQSSWQSLIAAMVALVAGAIAAVALHRVVLFGDRKPGMVIYFAFGRVEVLFIVLPLAVMAVLLFAFSAVAPALLSPDATPQFGVLAAAVVVVLGVLFLSVRFALLWPILVIEERYDFRQAWDLSQGNFWRLLGSFFLAVLPFALLTVVSGLLFQGTFMVTSLDELTTALHRAVDLLPLQSAINFVLSILITGLAAALLGYAYKALQGYGPDDVVQG